LYRGENKGLNFYKVKEERNASLQEVPWFRVMLRNVYNISQHTIIMIVIVGVIVTLIGLIGYSLISNGN